MLFFSLDKLYFLWYNNCISIGVISAETRKPPPSLAEIGFFIPARIARFGKGAEACDNARWDEHEVRDRWERKDDERTRWHEELGRPIRLRWSAWTTSTRSSASASGRSPILRRDPTLTIEPAGPASCGTARSSSTFRPRREPETSCGLSRSFF